jgi:radical SAM superfamily enzyme YgiQ (UPF0313 family)
VFCVKILLVQPAPFEPGRIGLENSLWLSEPVALTQLAAMVPDHEIRILDMRLEPDLVLNDTLLAFRPDVVGVTSMTTDCYQALAVLTIAKGTLGMRVFTLLGGHHPTLAPHDFEHEHVDAVCIGEGEDTFAELVGHLAGGGDRTALDAIAGLHFRGVEGRYRTTAKRAQNRELDTFPPPARHLIPERYRREYFFFIAGPMASMQTSRGCSFDCNFCAIWEFYERRTRFLSARAICDRLERMPERFVFFLDDNFLTSRKRIEALCDEIERRKIDKYYLTQGRTDFIAENPDLMRRLRDCGLMMVLSGYESNDDDALAALRKKNTYDRNVRAAKILGDLGIVSTGIFMVRPEFDAADFDNLWAVINEMKIMIPLLTVLTPLPGTQLWQQRQHELLTRDVRMFDLLHAVMETKLPRAEFYRLFASHNSRVDVDRMWRLVYEFIRARPKLFARVLPGMVRFRRRQNRYRPILENSESHLRDELGTIGPAARKRVGLPVLGASA